MVAQGLAPGVLHQASLTLEVAGLFCLNSEVRRLECSFQTPFPPKLYSPYNEAIIHDDKILERICIIHFFS